ncbi:MAG: flagellar export chaperone FliS [Gammaproteobacteria bacterium]|nr:flagellar export chaperone FliS [Gammaproteobacteria bacterium]
MSALALKAYQNTALESRCETSSKRDLVIMMYDAAIDSIRLAREHAVREEKRAASASTSRAISILAGLRETLDRGQGGSVAAHLDDFYQFLMRRLVRTRGGASSEDLAECQDLLGQVREAWVAITPQTVGQVNRRMFVVHS